MYYVNLLDKDGFELASMSDIDALKGAKAIAKQYLTDPEYKANAYTVEVRNHGTLECEWEGVSAQATAVRDAEDARDYRDEVEANRQAESAWLDNGASHI